MKINFIKKKFVITIVVYIFIVGVIGLLTYGLNVLFVKNTRNLGAYKQEIANLDSTILEVDKGHKFKFFFDLFNKNDTKKLDVFKNKLALSNYLLDCAKNYMLENNINLNIRIGRFDVLDSFKLNDYKVELIHAFVSVNITPDLQEQFFFYLRDIELKLKKEGLLFNSIFTKVKTRSNIKNTSNEIHFDLYFFNIY